jgi:hypothetical protein
VPGPKSFVWITQGVVNGYFDHSRELHRDTTPLWKFSLNLTNMETLAYSAD